MKKLSPHEILALPMFVCQFHSMENGFIKYSAFYKSHYYMFRVPYFTDRKYTRDVTSFELASIADHIVQQSDSLPEPQFG
jgi:hypothetical protein